MNNWMNVRYFNDWDSMANLDSLNRGPAKKIMIGKQVGYMKEDLIDFFIRQIK